MLCTTAWLFSLRVTASRVASSESPTFPGAEKGLAIQGTLINTEKKFGVDDLDEKFSITREEVEVSVSRAFSSLVWAMFECLMFRYTPFL